ncbi:MAG: malectin domain-containing carbohydrate-binding protein [Anditalea sp.]
MKTILIKLMLCVAFVIFCNFSHATNYYFSTGSGDDSRSASQAQNPSTPWKTINKLNKIFSSLQPGDVVLFKRGETFYGSISIKSSGSSGNPILIGAYGSGSKPIITSLVTLKDWKSVGNGIYESKHASLDSEVGIAVFNDQIQEMGRYPNSNASNGGYLNYESYSGNSSIKDSDLSSYPNWNGGEVVIRKNFWIIDRHKITSHSGTSIKYAPNQDSGYGPQAGYGYFVQNHSSTLDRLGEWYYNPYAKKMQVFFGSASPSSSSFEVSTIDHLVTNSSTIRHVTFEDLNFKGANKSTFFLGRSGSHVKILNCDIEYSGANGIDIEGISDFTIEGSKISNTNNNGILLRSCDKAIVRNNLIEDNYLLPGHGNSGDNNGVAILLGSNNGIIEYNEIRNTGYSGIFFKGDNTIVKNNFIDGFCMTKNDGAGIYSYSGRSDNYKNRKIIGNIVLNGKGVKEGTNMKLLLTEPQAEGIYLDDNVTDVEVVDNTVAHMTSKGIYLHNASNIKISNNTVFDSNHQLFLRNDLMGNQMAKITVLDNRFLSKDAFQNHIQIMTIHDDVEKLANFNENYYATPLIDDIRFKTRTNAGSSKEVNEVFNIKSWQKKYGNDWNSNILSKKSKPFKVKKIIGENKLENGTFDKILGYIGCDNCDTFLDKSGILDGGSLKVTASGETSTSVMAGALKKGKSYVLKFSAKSNKDIAISSYLRQNSSPWEILTATHSFEFTTDRQEFETVFSPLADMDNARMMFNIGNGENIEFWIDNMEFHEAEVEMINPEDKILFEYNASKKSKNINLNGEYVDLKNKKHSGSITVEPYSSILLVNTSNTIPSSNEPSAGKNAKFYNTGSSETASYQGSSYLGEEDLKSYFNSSNQHGNRTVSNEPLFQTERYAETLKYAIPLPNGTYTLQTFHNELWFGSYGPSATKGRRVFDISIEGEKVKDNFDLYVESKNKPIILTFEKVIVNDGVLNLDMSASANNATISGIAILDASDKNNLASANLRMDAGMVNFDEEEKPAASMQETIKLYPNPASNTTTLFINREITLHNILIYNMNGQLVQDFDPLLHGEGNGKYAIPLTNMKEGVYLVSLVGEREIIEQLRLIVRP